MSEERIDALKDELEELVAGFGRHADLLETIRANPEDYDDSEVEAYLSALEGSLQDADILGEAEAAVEPLESTAQAAQAEFLEGARVLVDDYEIEDVELVELDPPEAAMVWLSWPRSSIEQPLIS